MQLSLAAQHIHSFHTSPHVPYDSTSYNVTNVPNFFVKYKQYHATPSIDSVSPVLSVFLESCLTKSCIYQEVCECKHEESELMPYFINSIHLGEVVTITCHLKTKIPIEHHLAEGPIIHPSDFIIPGLSHTCISNIACTEERAK